MGKEFTVTVKKTPANRAEAARLFSEDSVDISEGMEREIAEALIKRKVTKETEDEE